VRYIGFINEEEKVAMFKVATALIMPTIGESFGLQVWEAFHLGCPVVASNAFDMPEQVGNAGLFLDPFNVQDMAEKIYSIWTDEDLRQELIRKGYNRVNDLTIENYAKQWEKIINEDLERIK
jgi:glycosyltransferase involved in cell wall biosynthesis